MPSIEAEIAPHHIPSKQPLTAWGTLSVMVLIYAVAFAGTVLLAFNTVQRLRIADTVKLGDEN